MPPHEYGSLSAHVTHCSCSHSLHHVQAFPTLFTLLSAATVLLYALYFNPVCPMKNSTLSRSLICLFVLSFFALPDAKAQFPQPPETASAACSYDEPHLFLSYETIIDDDTDPVNLTVVINAFVPADNPSDIDFLTFSALGTGSAAVTYTLEELAANPFVELTVNRNAFLSNPDVIVTASQNTNILAGLPFLPPIFIPWPILVVDLQARLDSDEPCLEITPLPVELISFDGAATDNGIELSWATASEQDNSHFEVERSADGKAFEQVGKVDGHGNSSTKISYSYTDFAPLSGLSYYRLKQVDFNGQYEYSNLVAVSVEANSADALQVVLAPNPCPDGNCQISIRNASGAQETRLELTDLSGRVLYNTTVQHAGNRTATLPMQELQRYKGLYILSAISGGKVVRQRVVLE